MSGDKQQFDPESAGQPVHSPESAGLRAAASASASASAAASASADAATSVGDGNGESLEKLREERDLLKNQVLRASADLENFRKRARREQEDERRYASLGLLRDLLPVLDNLERAAKAGENTPEAASLLSGVKLVQQQFESLLKQYHCQRIATVGEPFDPHVHQAISLQPSADHPHNTVILEAQAGYQLHDRVIRPAQVVVSCTPS